MFFRSRKKVKLREETDTFVERIREATKGNEHKFGDKDIKVEVVTKISQLNTKEMELLSGLYLSTKQFKEDGVKEPIDAFKVVRRKRLSDPKLDIYGETIGEVAKKK